MSDLDEFLAGDRPEDVAIYFSDGFVDEAGKLADYGESVEDGVVIVVEGERGRDAFHAATGNDAMTFAQRAMGKTGTIDRDLTGGDCPEVAEHESQDDHDTTFVFAFAEEQKEDVDGIYAEGDVIHAYAQCSCGMVYSHRWLAGER